MVGWDEMGRERIIQDLRQGGRAKKDPRLIGDVSTHLGISMDGHLRKACWYRRQHASAQVVGAAGEGRYSEFSLAALRGILLEVEAHIQATELATGSSDASVPQC